MASINNLSLKSVKSWEGREGIAFQGNIYLGSKKIGFWSQDGNGAIIDTVDLDNVYSERKLRDIITKKMLKINPKLNLNIDGELEDFMYNLLTLRDRERIYKRSLKKGYPITVVISNNLYCRAIALRGDYEKMTIANIKTHLKEDVQSFIDKHGKEDVEVEVFTSMDDFNLYKDDPIRPGDIKRN